MSSREKGSDNSAVARVATESISFRLEEDMLDQLRRLAAERKVSLNSLVSLVLDHYIKLGIYDRTFGFFSISQDVLRLTLAKQTDEEIDKVVAVAGAKIHKQIIMYLYGKVNKETIIDYLDIFGNRFETFRHFREGQKHTMTIYHGINRQFSLLYYDVTKSILALAKVETIEADKDVNDDGFTISFMVHSGL
jgi:predicted DNA-binding ribbon-helix-helix protein